MKTWIEQTRERFSGQDNVERPEFTRERRIPAHKTASFKGGGTQVDFAERRRPQNWFRRQFSRQMSQADDSIGEQAVAVAAAAFVIGSLEESTIPKQKQVSKGPEHPLTQLKSKKKTMTGEGSTRSLDSADGEVPGTAVADETTIKAFGPAPSLKKKLTDKGPAPLPKRIPTFNEKPTPSKEKVPTLAKEPLKNDRKFEAGKPKTPGDTTKTETASQKPDQRFTTSPWLPRPGHEDSKADAWQKDEFAKIKKRYEVLIAGILSWENKKKEKARRRLERVEGEREQIKLRASEKFRSEMDDIDQIAERAKVKAAERRRKEELKAKEKANTIRETGKIPKTCFCF